MILQSISSDINSYPLKYKRSDSIGELEIPEGVYYGVQKQRSIENLKISNQKQYSYTKLIRALDYVKKATAQANFELTF